MKRMFLVVLSVVMMLTAFVACNNDGQLGQNKSSQQNSSSDNTSSGKTNTSSLVDVTIPQLKDYGGKTFTFCFWQQPGDIMQQKIAAFNKSNNANLKVKVVANFCEEVSQSVVSGKPFDIVAYSDYFYSPSFMENNLEVLNKYILDSDYSVAVWGEPYYSSYIGIHKEATEKFTYKGNIYSVVSSYSILPYVIYYNKELSSKYYEDAKAYDPYELWRNGKWDYDRLKQLSCISNFSAAFDYIDLNVWLSINGVSAVTRDGDSFSSALKNSKVTSALNSYRDLFYGSNACMKNDLSKFNARSSKAETVYKIGTVEEYEELLKGPENASENDLPKSNLGVVPLPQGMTADGKYPVQIARAYGSAKGAADPTVAVIFALFESKYKNNTTMSAEVYHYVYESINPAYFEGFSGYNGGFPVKTGDDMSVSDCINRLGKLIAEGVPVNEAVNQIESSLNNAIKYEYVN